MTVRRAAVAGSRRRGRFVRLAGAALAALVLLGVAVIGGQGPAGAQDAERAEARIRLSGMVDWITHTILHQFTVKVDHLTSTVDYQVLVSSDNATILGIGGCGTATQTQTVTEVTAQNVKFIVHACAVGEATVTAEVRRTGTSRAEASASQRVTVAAMPESVFEFPAGAGQTAQQAVKRPGFVKAVSFPKNSIETTSVKVTWHGDNHDERPKTANGGEALTGFGLLFWRQGTPHPRYDQVLVKGKAERSHTYSNLQPGTTYLFRIHACNGTGSCGLWTTPPLEVTTKQATKPKSPHTISVDEKKGISARVNWRPDADTGGVDLTGFGIRWRVKGASWPTHAQAPNVPRGDRTYTMTPLKAGTTYEVSIQACNGTNRCSPWTAATEFRTPQPTKPKPPHTISVDEKKGISARVNWRPDADTGGVDLTGFGIRWRVKGTSWPTHAQAPNVPPGDRRYTISGLKRSTTYEVSIQACNGTNRCSPWTAAYRFETTAGEVPGPERVVTVTPGTTPTPGASPMKKQHPATADCPTRSRIPTRRFEAP